MAFLKSFGVGRRSDVLIYDPHKLSSPQVFLLTMVIFLAIVALAVSACAQIVGVLMVFTLMVGPAATAQRLTTGLWSGLILSATLAPGEAWLGIAIAYHTDWPVSFCIALLSALAYFAALLWPTLRVHPAHSH